MNLTGLKQTSTSTLDETKSLKESILQKIRRESDKTPEEKSKSRTRRWNDRGNAHGEWKFLMCIFFQKHIGQNCKMLNFRLDDIIKFKQK